MEDEQERLEQLFLTNGFNDFRWINPEGIVVSQWVRMKCRFGCEEYGRNASCPPNLPSVPECDAFFKEYKRAVILHFRKGVHSGEELKKWVRELQAGLLKLEKEVFLSGYHKAFILLVDCCSLCSDCARERENCKNPKLSRPTAEALAVDVYRTARFVGYSIEVRSDFSQDMDRYAILLIE